MPRVVFTQNLQRHVACPPCTVEGRTLRDALDAAFALNPGVRGYVLDDQGEMRQHMTVFIDGEMLRDRARLSDPLSPDAEVYVMQALSGG